MKSLLIAEKPDLMRQIQEVYEDNKSSIPYSITFVSLRGHVLRLKNPDELDEEMKQWNWDNIPYFPDERDGWKYTVISEKKEGKFLTSKERFEIVKKEVNSGNYDFIINAGDPDQEGQLLVKEVLHEIKNRLPVKRFWTNDLTESHVIDALVHLRDDDKDTMLINLTKAGYARQHLDYEFGINISRAASLKMNARVACGRVKTVILYIVCKREEEIANFKPKTVYGVKAVYEEGFDGTYFIPKDEPEEKTEEESEEKKTDEDLGIVWFDTKKEAEDLISELTKDAEVVSYEEKQTKLYAPKQFKLATLQIEAGKQGYNDSLTLAVLQNLYEKHLLSYPRTDCEYLSSNEDFFGILSVMNKIPEFSPYVKTVSRADLERVKRTKKWINDSKLEESGHSALRPTTNIPDFSTLSDDEIAIYKIVCRRFISMFLQPVVQMKTKLVTKIGDNYFISNGKRLIDKGYSDIYGTTFTDVEIPKHTIGDHLGVRDFTISEKTSKCPKRFTSPDLIAVCENPAKYLENKALKRIHGKPLKIGTPATRSPIIQQLIKTDKYLAEKREGKLTVIVPTDVGIKIIKNLGPCDICKVDMTGEMEEKLENVRLGTKSLEDFEKETKEHVRRVFEDIKRAPMTPFESTRSAAKTVGICPSCGKDIVEVEKGYFCRGYKKDGSGCNLKMWKTFRGADFDVDDALTLWRGGIVKKHLTFSLVSWDQKIKYNFTTNEAEFDADPKKALTSCPLCGKTLLANNLEFACESGDLSGMRFICGATLTDDDLIHLFEGEEVIVKCKKGDNDWDQKLLFDKKAKKIDFVKSEYSKASGSSKYKKGKPTYKKKKGGR